MTSADLVTVETGRGLATLTMDSPGNRNALSSALVGQLRTGLAAAVEDEAVRVVVLTHTGSVFCSGADLNETAQAYADRTPPPVRQLGDLLAELWDCPKPVVARVGGPARAGGLGLIAAADLAVCSEQATFAFTEVRIGVVPAIISATVLRRLTPRAAAELFLTGEVFDGHRAAQIGLVTAAAPAATLDVTVAAYCEALVKGGPGALAGTKRLLTRPLQATVRDDLSELSHMSVEYFGSPEAAEGMLAFREKRPPRWIPQS